MLTHAYLKIRSRDQDSMASCGALDQAQCTCRIVNMTGMHVTVSTGGRGKSDTATLRHCDNATMRHSDVTAAGGYKYSCRSSAK